jgi:hypothetical protein
MMSPRPSISFSDLESALDWASAGGYEENEAFIDRATGAVYFRSTVDVGDEEELPDDIDDETRYVPMPDKKALDLGRALVFDFVDREAPPKLADRVRAAFRGRGAYSKFKAMLEDADLLSRWYAFEAAETKIALLEWAEGHGFDVRDVPKD